MKKSHSRVKLYSFCLLICLMITAGRVYFSHRLRHVQMEEALNAHIIGIQQEIDVAVEQVYTVQALVVGAVSAGEWHIDWEKLHPSLRREEMDRYIRCVILAPDGIVQSVYPQIGNEGFLGANLYAGDYLSDQEAMHAKAGNLVISAPFTLENGETVIAGCLPVKMRNAAGNYYEWGVVAVCVAFPQMLGNLSNDVLRSRDYAYRITMQDAASGAWEEIANYKFKDKDHLISREFQIQNNRLCIEVARMDGWFEFGSTLRFFLKAVAGIVLLGALAEWILKRVRVLRRAATIDELTHLLNRAAGEKRITEVLQAKSFQNGAFLLMDIDHFKDVNDRLGHQRGDEVLMGTALILRKLFREEDVICRLGGDEFVVFFACPPKADLLQEKLKKLLQAMERTVVGNETVVSVSASIGVALAPNDAQTFAELYQKADMALYRSKEKGRNCATIYDSLDEESEQAEVTHNA